jgi:DNA-binding response OmpR family regulator
MPEGRPDEPGAHERTGSHILVVEDDSRTLRLERFILEEEGFEVEEAGSGEAALQDGSAALVLLDIGLPGIDGFTTCQRIRGFSQVPVIMVTAEDRDEDKVRGLEMGADDYVTKPFSTTELAARVKAVLRRYDVTSVLAGGAAAGSTPGRTQEGTPDSSSGAERIPGAPSIQQTPGVQVYEGTVRLVVETTGCIRRMIHFVD